ncbi:MAG: rhomboid family intramembrane serine protease [Tepidisphaeraceae bacterium]|jgi:membrane associated rhomboid family serine protease
MLLPIRTDCPLHRIPWTNWGLIAFNILIFILTSFSPDGAHGPLALHHGQPVRDLLALDPQNPALWQYFTYQFLHENWLHVLGNMLFLYIFGNNINDRMGNFGYLGFYLAGGVMAGVGHAMFDSAPVIGASGAVAAVTGAYLVLLPRSNITLLLFFFWVYPFEISSLWFVLFNFMQDVLGEKLGGRESVAHMAHITGTVFGAVLCLTLLLLHLLPRDQFDMFGLVARWNRRRQYRGMVSRGYNPFGYVPPQPVDVRSQQLDPRTMRILEMRAEISEAIAHHNLPHAAFLFLELKKLDPTQVLSRQAQLDVANQLASQQLFLQAAEAYEQFLTHYPNFEQIEQVELMLGVIYARYIQQYERARQLLLRALARLHTEREIQWARSELSRIEPLIAPQKQER